MLAALIGVVVSTASWGFLELVYVVQHWVYEDIPDALGYDVAPSWWPLPWLALAGLLTAFAVERLPGRGGHVPAEGLKTGGAPTRPVELPGVLLAATATLGLGLVLGPEAPLIALGMGLGILSMRLVRRDAPQQAVGLMAAAGSFAAVSTIFGSPVIGAVILIEATGLGGPVLPLVLLPGLLSAGIGLARVHRPRVLVGVQHERLAAEPVPPAAFLPAPAGATSAGRSCSRSPWQSSRSRSWSSPAGRCASSRSGRTRSWWVPGLVVGLLAIAFGEATDLQPDAVLFSGQEAFGSLFDSAATVSVSTLMLLFLFKGLAWSISLGNFRGGPTFPAIFLGVVAGLIASHLPGYAETQAVAALMGAMCVSILRLPLSSVMIALLLTSSAGLAVAPLVIVAVVVAYLASLTLTAYVDSRVGPCRRAGRARWTPLPPRRLRSRASSPSRRRC